MYILNVKVNVKVDLKVNVKANVKVSEQYIFFQVHHFQVQIWYSFKFRNISSSVNYFQVSEFNFLMNLLLNILRFSLILLPLHLEKQEPFKLLELTPNCIVQLKGELVWQPKETLWAKIFNMV